MPASYLSDSTNSGTHSGNWSRSVSSYPASIISSSSENRLVRSTGSSPHSQPSESGPKRFLTSPHAGQANTVPTTSPDRVSLLCAACDMAVMSNGVPEASSSHAWSNPSPSGLYCPVTTLSGTPSSRHATPRKLAAQ